MAASLSIVSKTAILFYADDAYLRRNGIVEHLKSIGIVPRKVLLSSGAQGAMVADADVVILLRDNVKSGDAITIHRKAKAAGIPIYDVSHRKSGSEWATLAEFAKTSGPIVHSAEPPTSTRSKRMLSDKLTVAELQDQAALAEMYATEADDAKARITHLEAELANAQRQISEGGFVAREELVTDLARANAERQKAQREVTDLTERLAAAEARCRQATVAAEAKSSKSSLDGRVKLLLQAWRGGAIEAEDVLKRIEKMIGGE